MKQGTAEGLVDLSEPLLPQVAALGDRYDAWVHRSIKPDGSLRIFRSDGWERLSHIPWWLVLVVWIPIVVGLFVGAVTWRGLAVGPALGYAFAGLFAWTLMEYGLHRFLFHYRPRSAIGRRIHFLAHGIHHLDPWDATRLVFPPLAGMIIATPIFLAFLLVLQPGPAMAAMSGLLAGYIVYDMTHYYTHHGRPRGRWGKYLKAYHLAHHHKHWTRMFGVSQPLWDIVFRTGRPAVPSGGRPAAPRGARTSAGEAPDRA